jgi:hypothetical protein
MKKGILELIKKIYGSNALSKVLGTRTNVIRLPDNELKQYTNKELNIEAASDKLVQKAKTDINELLAEYPRMNDAEKLIFEGNLTRLGNKLGVTEKGPAADVIKFGTGEKVSPEGVMSLTEKIGQKNAPGTLVGNLESRIKQLEASGEELSKLKGKTYDEFMKDITQGQKAMRKLEDEGLVRAAAREIINKDIKSGKIKLPKEIEQDMVQGGGEPINVLRQFYGEGALEQLDSMIPEFKKMYSPKEAADAATKKFKFEFKADRPPGSTSIEDAKKTQVTDLKTEATKRKSVDDLIDEYNANQDRLRLSDKEGGTLIGYEEYEQLRKRNKDIAKTLEDKGISSKVEKKPEAEIIPFTNKPDPEDFATGGRVGMAGGGILKLAMKFFNDNNPVSAYKKYLKYVKETAQKDPAKLAPEVGGIVVGSELIHRGLRRKLKEVKEKNNENDSENLETDNRTEKAGGGVSQGLDYLTGIERRGYSMGTLIKRTLLMAETLSELKPEYLKKLRRLEGYLGSINMDSKGGEQAAKKTMDKINTLKQEYKVLEKDLFEKKQLDEFDITNRTNNAKGGILKVAQKLIKKPKKYKFTGEESLNDLYELERKGKITREDMNVYSPRYLEYLDAQIINKEKLYTPKEWEKTPEVLKNKMRGRIDPDWEEANFGEEFNWDQARSIEMKQQKQLQDFDITGRKKNAKGGRVGFAVGGGFGSVPVDPMEAMYVDTFGFNPFPKYGFNSYMDYNTARITGTPMNQNISDLEDYLGTLESAREINLPGVTKDLSAEDISRLQEEYVKKMAKTSNALNPTVTASTSTSTPDYRQQALSEMLSRYNVSSLGDIKNFNYLIPEYKDKNNLQVRAFETRIPDLAVSRRAQQLEDAAIRAQQDQEAYKNRISQVDPNALRNSYLQNLQNTSSFDVNQYQSKLRSNLARRTNNAKGGLNYLMGL